MPAPSPGTLCTNTAARCLTPPCRARPTTTRTSAIPTITDLHVNTAVPPLPAPLSLPRQPPTPLAALTLALSLLPAARAPAAAALRALELPLLHAARQALRAAVAAASAGVCSHTSSLHTPRCPRR